jgi:alpha-1,2-mannosyltransferase
LFPPSLNRFIFTDDVSGFHASTEAEFAAGFEKALALSPEDALAMRLRARKSSWRFSEQVFSEAWNKEMRALVDSAVAQQKRKKKL